MRFHSIRLFVSQLVVSLLVAHGASSGVAAAAPPSPSAENQPPAGVPLVLISIDTLRSDRLPVYGYEKVSTPSLSALAADGVVFERAYTHVPLTLPAHASLFSGTLPPEHGVRDNIGYRVEAATLPWLPRRLRQAGYATGAAVSAYVLRGEGGMAEGFDFYDDAIPARDRAGVGGLQRPGGATLDALRPWLQDRGGRPFFLFLHLFEPHTPYDPPAPFAARYPSAYDGEVAAADAIVGRLFAELKRLNLYDRSAIVVLSDHGEGLGDHGEDEHGVLLYRESLQIPLILKLPGGLHGGKLHQGKRVETPVGLRDVAPALLELAGLAPPPTMTGRSLLCHLEGPCHLEDEVKPRAVYAETFYPRLHFGWSELTSLIDGPHHYIQGPDPELYDLISDPAERHNLLPKKSALAARLRDQLAEFGGDLEEPSPVGEEERRALAALGYVGTVGGAAEGPRADPKTRLSTVADLKTCLSHYGTGAFETAAAACRRAVETNPRSLDAWEYLGRSEQALGRKRQAFQAFVRALDLAGGRAGHLAVTAALLLIEAGRAEGALTLLEHEIPQTVDSRPLRLLAARTLVLLGRLDEAATRAETLVTDFPEDADAVYLRGAVRMGQQKLTTGEADLRRALELAPDHTAALADLATLLKHQGRVEEARELVRRALTVRPGDALLVDMLRRFEQR